MPAFDRYDPMYEQPPYPCDTVLIRPWNQDGVVLNVSYNRQQPMLAIIPMSNQPKFTECQRMQVANSVASEHEATGCYDRLTFGKGSDTNGVGINYAYVSVDIPYGLEHYKTPHAPTEAIEYIFAAIRGYNEALHTLKLRLKDFVDEYIPTYHPDKKIIFNTTEGEMVWELPAIHYNITKPIESIMSPLTHSTYDNIQCMRHEGFTPLRLTPQEHDFYGSRYPLFVKHDSKHQKCSIACRDEDGIDCDITLKGKTTAKVAHCIERLLHAQIMVMRTRQQVIESWKQAHDVFDYA